MGTGALAPLWTESTESTKRRDSRKADTTNRESRVMEKDGQVRIKRIVNKWMHVFFVVLFSRTMFMSLVRLDLDDRRLPRNGLKPPVK